MRTRGPRTARIRVTGLGGGLTAFVGAVNGRPGTLPTYYANGQPKPINIDAFDPALADSSVAPKDLLALIADGTIRGLGEKDLAKYQARLQKEEQVRLTTNANRDMSLQESLGIGGERNYNREPVVYRDQIASGMTNIADVTRKMQRQGFTIPLLIGGATTSPAHTSVRIEPEYAHGVFYVKDASRSVGVCQTLVTAGAREEFFERVRT